MIHNKYYNLKEIIDNLNNYCQKFSKLNNYL